MKEIWGGLHNRDLVVGVAVTTLVFLSAVLVPLVGALVMFLTPLPVAFYCTKLGYFAGIFIFTVSLTLVLFILGNINPDVIFPLMFFIFIGGAGIMLTEMLRRSFSVDKILAIASGALLVCCAALLLFFSYQLEQSPGQILENFMQKSIAENIKLYEQLDAPQEQIAMIKEHASQMASLLVHIFPAMMLISFVIMLWLNIIAARIVFQKTGLYFPDFGDLTHWRAPDKLVWLLIVSGVLLLLPVGGMGYIGLNALIICMFVYLCAGFAIIGFFFNVKKVSLFLRAIFYIVVLFQQYLLLFIMALGLFDLWADFRKRIKPAQDAGS